LIISGDIMVKRSNGLLFSLFLIAFVVIMQPVSGQAFSQPQLPHTFWGKVLIGDTPAGMGLEVEAVGPGVISGIDGNPVTSMAGGVYGLTGMSSQQLLVQGDIEPGTPLEFFVGGVRAEVYPVATGGPWMENYSYTPGDITELNLRIAAQPSVGETREPTPVQTRLPAEAVSGYTGTLPQPGVVEPIQPGDESSGAQPAIQSTNAGVTPVGTSSPGASVTTVNTPSLPPGSKSMTTGSSPLLLFGIIAIVVIILAMLFYAMKRKEPEGETEKEKAEEKTEVQERK
jgi:hypothetical protein